MNESLIARLIFFIRIKVVDLVFGSLRKSYYKLLGMRIGKKTSLKSIQITWPHQVSIGSNCRLEHGIYFKYDGIYSKGASIIIEDDVFIGSNCEFNINSLIIIGKFSNIASGCRFIDHNHGTQLGYLIGPQPAVKGKIILGEDVWLGCNVVVLKGVNIGSGVVIAAGAVVTKSIPANQIWGGIPARFIKSRI